MKYKMVVLDIDGTILDDKKQISDYTLEVLKNLHDKGIEIVIATGRNYYEAKKLTDKIIKDINLVIMANNGCIVRNSLSNKIIEEKYLKYDIFKSIYDEGIKKNLYPIIHVNEESDEYEIVIEHNKENEIYHGYMNSITRRYKKVNLQIEKVSNILSVCYVGNYEKLEKFQQNILNNFKSNFSTTCSRNLRVRALLEFMNAEGGKWNSILQYAQNQGVSPNEIIAIGDDNNDIEMIKNAGLGIAMKNGTEEIKNTANFVSEYDCNNSGAAFEIEKIFK